MTDATDAIQTILVDVDELLREKFRDLGYPDTPFVLMAVGPDGGKPGIRSNILPAGLREMAADLAEAAEEAGKWPANDDQAQ